MTTCVLEILGDKGYTTVEWDPDNPEEVAKARAEFDKLKAAGFLLFVVTEVDDLPVEVGRVTAQLASAPPLVPAQTPEPVSAPEPIRGRPRKGTQTTDFVASAPRTIAVRPMRGG